MRIKILIFPAALALAIVIFIAYAWPELNSALKAKQELDESKKVLASINEKKNNIENLKSALSQNQDKESFVLSYLPLAKSEERIIDGMNYLASNSGLSLVNLSLKEVKEEATEIPTGSTAESTSKEVLFSGAPENKPGTSVGLLEGNKIRMIKIEANLVGSYENIRTFLEEVYKMEMFHNLASVSISSSEEETSQATPGAKPSAAGTGPGILSLTAEINFGYMSEVRIGRNYSAPIFSQSSFDFAPYQKLTNLVSKKIPVLEIGDQGKANPFLP
ncbi:MAG: hypothetical protein NT136_02050 [Candidatus Moranbacteria bacterium]|nr:hypothetical protein [Candidatus Moranbacteria bacterium]